MSAIPRGAKAPAALSLLLLAAFPGCGERTMSAQEFVDEANANGATLVLEEELTTEEEDKSLRAVSLRPLGGGRVGHSASPAPGRIHGTLAVYDDADGADRGIEECRAAVEFLCYRAANVVVRLEGNGVEAARLAAAMERMASD